MVLNNKNHTYYWAMKINLVYIKINLENKDTDAMKRIM